MKPISAIDAIAPAFRRTRWVLAQPFRFGFFLKAVVVAALSASNLIAMGILLPMQAASLLFQILMAGRGRSSSSTSPLAHLLSVNFGPALFLGLAFGILFALLVSAALFYLGTRLRFVLFAAVLHGERKFGRAWANYGPQTWRYYGMSILIALACMLVATAIASPLILVSLRLLRSGGGSGASGFMMGYLVVSMMVEYALIFVAVVVDGWAYDFLLPPMAIEDASIEGSFARFLALVRNEPAALFVYTLLRFALRMALTFALFLTTVIPVVMVAAILAAVGVVFYHLLWHAGVGGQVLFGLYAVVAGVATFVLYLLAIFTASGIVSVFTQAYALIFYAARYPQLGNLLDPPPPVVALGPEFGTETKPESGSPPDLPPPFLPEPPELW